MKIFIFYLQESAPQNKNYVPNFHHDGGNNLKHLIGLTQEFNKCTHQFNVARMVLRLGQIVSLVTFSLPGFKNRSPVTFGGTSHFHLGNLISAGCSKWKFEKKKKSSHSTQIKKKNFTALDFPDLKKKRFIKDAA